MSDITALFGLFFVLGLGLNGMLITWWLLFPNFVERARLRVERTPWATFFMGVAGVIGWAVPILILLALPVGPAKMLGAIAIFLALTFATLGAAGIAAQMARRLARFSPPGTSDSAAYLRGALALTLAAAVPILGWAVVVPLALIQSMGAAIFALLRWTPKPALRRAAETPPNNQSAPSS
jgi:hypothetical protein